MRDAAEVRARVAGAARGRAEVRTPSPSSLSMVSGRSVLSQLQARRRMYRFTVAVCSLFLKSWRLVALFSLFFVFLILFLEVPLVALSSKRISVR